MKMSLFPAYGQKPAPEKEENEWLSNKSYKEEQKQSKFVKKKKKRRREKSPEYEDAKIPHREELIAKHSSHKTFLEDVKISPKYAFREDLKGDKSFLSLTTLPLSQTAEYERKIKEFDKSAKRKKSGIRYFSKDYQKKFKRQKFQDLSSLIKAKETFDYQKTYIKFSPEAFDQSEEVEDSEFQLHEIQQKTKTYNESLRLNPKDVKTWLEYVDFQDLALADSEFHSVASDEPEPKKKKSNSNVMLRTKAIVEKKLSILKSALDHNPKSVDLSVKRLNLLKEVIMDSSTLNRQWKELLFLLPTNVQVWDQYLTFLASHFTTFSLSKITQAYQECFQRLQSMTTQANFRNVDLEEQMSHIIIRLWHLWAR